MSGKSYRAVFFDMDGTLLPMEIDEFLGTYFKSIGTYVAKQGHDLDTFMTGFKLGVKAMAANDGTKTNFDAFWDTFFTVVEGDRDEWLAMLDVFYNGEFGHIGDGVVANPAASRAVETLVAKGYPVVLATQPMFPDVAVNQRLRWSGVREDAFVRKTRYDNSMAVKPKLLYYAENLAACGLTGEDVLMVGNNTVDDLVFAGLGADVYLVTDHLLNPADISLDQVKHGTMEEFAAWADALPACENPATEISDGAIAPADREKAFQANILPGVTDDAPLFAAEKSTIEEGLEG